MALVSASPSFCGDIMLKYLFEPLLAYPLFFWLVNFAVFVECLNLICGRNLLRMLPLAIRFVLLLVFTAAMAPMVVEAFQALISNETLPKTVEGVKIWPMLGFIAWVSFLSASLTFLAYQLWEPWKEEALVKIPSAIANYLGTALLVGTIHASGLTTFLFVYSYQREIPIFTPAHVLLLALVQFGIGLSFSLRLRTFGFNRSICDVLGLALAGMLAFWISDHLQLLATDWVLWTCLFSALFWAIWGVGRFMREMVRYRMRLEGELPLQEAVPNNVCPHCDREFVTLHGLRTHIGRMHKSAPEVT